MNWPTLLVLLLLLVLVVLAVRHIRKKKLLFSCGGDCSSCPGGCKRHEPRA
ncbi:MAG: FeoB-associated Cys-rich membrane protein [Clostridiales bacterium]|nr:FeoB-associated Cys-rich membrane protein [Clostridiales bacterium]MDY5513255.1 FeoB-associated Cys-rich membrane protein [Candidatus Ventricola sp.]